MMKMPFSRLVALGFLVSIGSATVAQAAPLLLVDVSSPDK